MDDRFIDTFKAESYELLQQMEGDLLSLESNPEDQDHIQSVFRAAHTIKGSAAMFGFTAISDFAHGFETALEDIRSGSGHISQEMIDLTLRAKDHLRALLAAGQDEEQKELEATSASILAELSSFTPVADTKGLDSAVSDLTGEGKRKTYRISFTPNLEIFTSGTNPQLLLREIKSLGEASIFADTSRVPELSELNPEKLYIAWEILLTTSCRLAEIRDVFIFVESESEILIEELEEKDFLDSTGFPKRLGEILVDRGAIGPKQLKELLASQKLIGERIREAGLAEDSAIEAALHLQEHFKQTTSKERSTNQASTLRVESSRLDQLIDLVGELVTVQARVGRLTERIADDSLVNVSEELERLIDDLRDNAMSLRMLPIGSTFSQFRRLVRDLSLELGKNIRLITTGEETELDKTVIDRLHDPLVHIIRNAIDHGIESPADRKKAGKEEQGTIYLEALHSGASVHIIVRDDGAGISAEKVKQRAIERGLLLPNENPSEEEIYQLLFAAGFSTAEKVTAVSGRGVGLDVVAKDIQSLSGTVVVNSTPGEGTRFTLALPLTLAIIDGLRIAIGDEIYVIPLAAVESCLELNQSQVETRQRMINHRGSLLPYIDLSRYLEVPNSGSGRRQMVIVESNNGKIGLLVDEVIGDHQTVIKSLGSMFRTLKGFSGATIMGDGSISLILDVHTLIAAADTAETDEYASVS